MALLLNFGKRLMAPVINERTKSPRYISTENRNLSRLRLPPDARNFGAAIAAGPVLQVEFADAVAGALDEHFAAAVAEGALRGVSRDVAQVNVLQAGFQGQFPAPLQGAHRSGVVVQHLV